MNILQRLSLQSKLILILLLVSLTAIVAVSYSSYRTARAAAEDSAQRQMMGVRVTKTNLIQQQLANFRDQLTSFATSRTALESIKTLGAALRKLDESPLDAAAQAKLEALYKDKYLPALERQSGIKAEAARVIPPDNAGRALQYLYIANNPNPYEQGYKWADAGDSSEYTAAHRRFHEIYTQVATRIGLEDLLLIDGPTLRVVYSYQKSVDLGTDLNAGPYSNTALATSARQMLKAGDRSTIHFADFELYRPKTGKPAAFLCAPVFDGPTPAGVIAFQLPIENFIRIMTANFAWESEGLGKSGEVYLVGSDYLMRTRSRFMIEDPKAAVESFRAARLPTSVLAQIERQKNVILGLPVNNESTQMALAGKAGVHEIRDYRDVPVISAYGPLDFLNVRWAVLAEMDASEAYGPVAALARRAIATTAGLAILVSLFALGAASVVTRPVRALTAAARRVTAGELDVQVKVDSRDEIRELADAFNHMTRSLKQKTTDLEATIKRNEELLLNILPAHAAARLRDGDENPPQTFADVSILYARIIGLDNAPGGESEALRWLHQLVVAFDDAAETHSVEKLKTEGPTYFAACGLSVPRPDHHQRVVDFAQEMLRIGSLFSREKDIPLEIDVGINSGSVTGGVIGRKKFIYDLWGETVNLARLLKADGISTVQITQAVAARLQGDQLLERQPDVTGKNGQPIVVYRLGRPVEMRP